MAASKPAKAPRRARASKIVGECTPAALAASGLRATFADEVAAAPEPAGAPELPPEPRRRSLFRRSRHEF